MPDEQTDNINNSAQGRWGKFSDCTLEALGSLFWLNVENQGKSWWILKILFPIR